MVNEEEAEREGADHAEKMVVAQQGGSGLDGVAYYSTCSVSVTVGTIHPQRF